jgi:hypothetical protein
MEGKSHPDRILIITGGQTGIDRAALDFCLDHQLPCGGWCPQGRKAEDGSIDRKYPVKELPEAGYAKRTAANAVDSDATVIFHPGSMFGGTLKSFEFARKEYKPVLLLDMSVLDISKAGMQLVRFLGKHRPVILNISGPRQSDWAEGYRLCYSVLLLAFEKQTKTPSRPEGGNGVEIRVK